jgi:hypothetical protein
MINKHVHQLFKAATAVYNMKYLCQKYIISCWIPGLPQINDPEKEQFQKNHFLPKTKRGRNSKVLSENLQTDTAAHSLLRRITPNTGQSKPIPARR